MIRGRKPVDVACPKGFPFRLYEAENGFVLATSKNDVKKATKSKTVKLVNVTSLISSNGHGKANTILKQFGDRWVCKDGHIFYSHLQ